MAIIDKPTNYFEPVTYTGNGGTQSITSLDFQPDWVWIKRRNALAGHKIQDSVRGAAKQLFSNNTNAEQSNSDLVTSFNSDGFTLSTNTDVNGSGGTYVAWNWKEQAGVFDIVSFTGNATIRAISHSLSAVPSMMIIKCRSEGGHSWKVYHKSIGATGALSLQNTGATDTDSNYFNNTAPTSSVFTVGSNGDVNTNGATFIAYLFGDTSMSKMGSYTGNGNADGTFVYTGQKSSFVMIKNTSGTGDWLMYDSKRNPANVTNLGIKAHSSDAEASYDNLDILSNGFKLRRVTSSLSTAGSTYIYMAFAENPFVTSTGVPATAR